MIQTTLSIIKPDAMSRNIIGKIISYIEDAGLQIVAQKMTRISEEEARLFYKAHHDAAFFNELIEMMSQGPVLVQAIKGEDAIMKFRTIMGPTDPKKANKGTIRGDLGLSIGKNSVHGSDSEKAAIDEVAFFFSESEILR